MSEDFKGAIILPEEEDEGAVYMAPGVRNLDARSDIGQHENVKADDLGEHLGDGFFVSPEPVLVQRGPDGGIVRTTPLNEIPGVEVHGVKEEPTKPSVVPMSREERGKLVDILSHRLFKYYQDMPPDHPKFNPFRDGIPEIVDADPLNLTPDKSEAIMMNETPSNLEIFMWIKKFVGARASIVDKQQGRGGLSLRIERNPD